MDSNDVQRIIAEEIRAARRGEHETSTSTDKPATTTEGPPQAKPLNLPDAQVALELLQRETGSREQALEVLALDGQALGAMKSAIDKRKAELQAAEQERLTQEWLRSPAGKRYTADAAIEAKQKKATLVAQARTLLETDPQLTGIDLDGFSDDELIQFAGVADKAEPEGYKPAELTPTQEAALKLRAKWFTLSKQQRAAFAVEAGIDEATFQQIAQDAAAQTSGNIFGS